MSDTAWPSADAAPPPAIVSAVSALLRCRRPPDVVIGESAAGRGDYLRRWHVVPHASKRADWPFLRHGNIYLHNFNRSDDDRAEHDHPWWNVSILLHGSYLEHSGGTCKLRRPGSIVFRAANTAHRIELLKDADGKELPVWTLFLTGPNVREWGFLCAKAWRHNREFTALGKDGTSMGCGE